MTNLDPSGIPAGTQLGNYRIERRLGRGGMGAVYLAYDTTLRRPVALKVVAESGETEISRVALLREARNAAALNHPNICSIYEVGEADGLAFIAMESVEGPSLQERLEGGALPLDEAVRYGLQAVAALAYAHEAGVVHRDFKAANAIVTPDGRLKVVDFGLAQRRDATSATETTQTSIVPAGSQAGTPYAMAPEQVRGEPADARTDIWALGVLLYEMVSGTRPFRGPTIPELYSAILRDPPRPLPNGLPGELRRVIERCLQKAPELRYRRASEVGAALELVADAGARPRPGWRRRAGRAALLAAAALLAVAAVLVGLNVAGVRDRLGGGGRPESPVSLAVLPLRSLTSGPDQDDFADGLTEDIVRVLSRRQTPGFRVVPADASMAYERSDEAPDRIGRDLDAGAVLKGSVARTADRVRIVADLVRTSSGRTVWSETYDRDVADVFAVEHEIADAVLRALGAQPAAGGSRRLAETRPANPKAHDLYLRGLSHAVRNDERDIDEAIALLEKSVALDPTFAPAYAYLALSYGTKASAYAPDDPQWEEKGFAAVERAIELDADSPEAHYARAVMLWRPSYGFPSREALAELRKALAAQPNFAEAWHQHAFILYHVGHLDEAAREVEKAIAINPANTIARFRLVPIYVYQQRFEEALALLDRIPKEVFPAQWTYQKAWALISLNRLDEAGRLVDDALEANPVDQGGVLHAARAMVRAKRGDRAGAEADIVEAVRIGKDFIHFHHTAYSIGAVYATLGDLDKAEEWIERAANDGFPNYAFFEADVNLAPLRATPRFREFVLKLRKEWGHIPGEPD